jgi:hypothetical protein
MKFKKLAILAILAMVLGAAGAASAKPRAKKKAPKAKAELLTMLPASEIAMTLDAKRLMDEGLPQILSSNQPMLAQIFANIDRLREKTGIDLRHFHQVAVGVSAKRNEAKSYVFEPIILARGKFSAAAVIAAAKAEAGNAYREEKMGDRTVFVFSAEKLVADAKSQTGKTAISEILDTVLDGLSREMALAALDGETVAVGSLPQMRSMLEAKTRLAPEIAAAVARRAGAIASLAGDVPEGMSGFIDLDNDLLGKNLNSIRKLAASMDVSDGATLIWLSARTVDAAQARELKLTLEDLLALGKILLSSTKGADKQVYTRMVENAKVVQTGTEVSLDLRVPQADIDVLIGQKK